jgi:gas vesicle protein
MNQNQNRNENKYEENEFLASFSQSVNVEGYESCTCSSTCIRNEITILKNKIERIEEKLDAILQKMDNNIIKNCDKMGDHIDFVNNVYDTVKVPLHYLSNKVQKMIGVVNNNHHDARVSNKIEDLNNAINDDEYLFTENE